MVKVTVRVQNRNLSVFVNILRCVLDAIFHRQYKCDNGEILLDGRVVPLPWPVHIYCQ